MNDNHLIGELLEIIFQNEQNLYTVCTVMTEDGNAVTCVGYLPSVAQGEQLSLTGEWVTHPEYGEQFKVQTFEKILPTTSQSILLYLSSGIIKGVKEGTAKKIVDKFGDQSLDVILNEWRRLAEIKGISLARADEIHRLFIEKQCVQQTVMFLQKFGVTAETAMKIQRKLGTDAIEKMKKNPYILCEEVSGIGFKTADRIASEMGVEPTHPGRIASGIRYTLFRAAQYGHTFLPQSELFEEASRLLEVEKDLIQNEYTGLVLGGLLVEEKGSNEEIAVYLPVYKNAEMGIVRKILELSQKRELCSAAAFSERAEKCAARIGITLSQEQKNAVSLAHEHSAFIITGGPGTGKTTVINCLIQIFEGLRLKVALTAPTGRAAKRMSECTDREAKTIHRLLEIDYSTEDTLHFMRNEHEPLEMDVLIVDEMSMVDTLLFHALLNACRRGARIIMVGDSDQLPSVGAGNTLSDLIESGALPVCRLTTIYRQAAESMIVQNAHRINRGEELIVNRRDKDFFLMSRSRAQDVISTVCDLCERRLPATYGYDPMTDIQVISPMRRGSTGIKELNRALQARLNPPSRKKDEIVVGDYLIRTGDKVMQIRNNYDLCWFKDNGEDGIGVFNGDVGVVQYIEPHDRTVTVLFDGERAVTYDSASLDELEPAYAITVHKSQGSEFPATVLVLFGVPAMLTERNLFYTAVSRAKELVVIVGNPNIASSMIQNHHARIRHTGLLRALCAAKQ